MKNMVYFDTNTYNHICDTYDTKDYDQLSRDLRSKGLSPILSPLNVLEFTQNKDEIRREELIYLCQKICQQAMLVEPEALIVDYIVGKNEDSRTVHLKLDNLECKSSFGIAWRDIKLNSSKTFKVELESVRKFDVLKELNTYFQAHYSRGLNIKNFLSYDSESIIDIREYITSSNRAIRKTPAPTHREPPLNELMWILITQILCVGTTLFPEQIDKYWNAIDIQGSKRIEFAFDKLSFLTESGPFVGMGLFASMQASTKHNNGNLFDLYHLMYLPYIEHFVTADVAFHRFRASHSNAKILSRIVTPIDFLGMI